MTNRASVAIDSRTVRLVAPSVERSSRKAFDCIHATCYLSPQYLSPLDAKEAKAAIEAMKDKGMFM
jgi:hypothetical protein